MKEKSIERKCKNCGAIILITNKRQRFCNRVCRQAYQRLHYNETYGKRLYSRKCNWCGTTFASPVEKRKYCSVECRELAKPISQYKLRFAVLYRDEFRCQYCGATPQDGVKLHVDHIVPKSKGGIKDITNLITTCEACNLGKSDLCLDKYPTVGFSQKAIEILSREVLDRKALKDLGIYSEYQRFLKMENN